MKGLDTIYEAIAKDRKISYKYFTYEIRNNRKSKKYNKVENSKIIKASPYFVSWDDGFWLTAIEHGVTMWSEADCVDTVEDEEDLDYIDDMGNWVHVSEIKDDEDKEHENDVKNLIYDDLPTLAYLELEHLEQIKILPEAREGQDIAQREQEHEKRRQMESLAVQTKLKIGNFDVSEVMDKLGGNVTISPIDDDFFIATINEELTPELYIWIRTLGSAEILFPKNMESLLQQYFLEISKGNDVLPFFLYCSIAQKDT